MSLAGLSRLGIGALRSVGPKAARGIAKRTFSNLAKKYGPAALETAKDWLLDTTNETFKRLDYSPTKDLPSEYMSRLLEAPAKRARAILGVGTGGQYRAQGSYGGKIKFRKFRGLSKRRVRRYKRRLNYIGKAVRPLYSASVNTATLNTVANIPWCSYVYRVDAVGISDFVSKSIIAPLAATNKDVNFIYGGQRGYFWFKNPYSFSLLIRVYKGHADVDETAVGTDAASVPPQINSCFVWPQVRKGQLKIVNVRTVVLGAGDSQKVFFNLRCNKALKLLYDNSIGGLYDKSWRAPVICLQIYPDIMTNIASMADLDTIGFPAIKNMAFIQKTSHYGCIPNDAAVLDSRINLAGITSLTAPLTTFDVKADSKMGDSTI